MRELLRRIFPVSWQDNVIALIIMVVTLDISLLLQPIGADDSHAGLILVLGVLMVARFTVGYLYGILASMVSAIVVNYAFLPPYYQFDLRVTGHPLTFITLLCVAIVTSMLTSNIKQQEYIRIEAERERLRANLLRAVGHDLRTPLTSIIGSAEAILDPANHLSQEENVTLLHNICDEADWLVRMVENLLSITRVGGESYRIKKTPEVPEEILAEVLDSFQKRCPDVAVEVEVPDAWLEVPMDAMLIEQVLCNLMENAVIHGKATEITVQVESGKDWARFSVCDNGTGIPADKIDHLCADYMEMADTSTGDKKHNMGVGLVVCRDIVLVHGGEFAARNRPEGGAEFYFILPLEEERHGGY